MTLMVLLSKQFPFLQLHLHLGGKNYFDTVLGFCGKNQKKCSAWFFKNKKSVILGFSFFSFSIDRESYGSYGVYYKNILLLCDVGYEFL